MLASLKDNDREIRLDQEGKLTGMEGFDESSQRMVRAALAGEGLSKPNVLDNMSSPPIKLLGEPAGESVFQLIGPLGKVITEQRPNLKWREIEWRHQLCGFCFRCELQPRRAKSAAIEAGLDVVRPSSTRPHLFLGSYGS